MDIARNFAILRATLTNIMAWTSPELYVRLIADETGRGGKEDNGRALETYCLGVFNDYITMFEGTGNNFYDFIQEKTIIEYGPGDFLGVALLFLCGGAKQVYCIDRFSLKKDDKYLKLYNRIIKNYSGSSLQNRVWDELIDGPIKYISARDGIHLLDQQADIIISRAALEHCNDLEKTFRNFNENLKPGGVMLHEVDLTSHGMHLKKSLDFLNYSIMTWSCMTSCKGYPNRWRRNKYRELLKQNRFQIMYEKSRYDFSAEEVNAGRHLFTTDFKNLPEEDLKCSHYSFVATKEYHD